MDSSWDSPWSQVPRLIHLARTYRAAGNIVSALAALEDALIEAPDNPDLLTIYARTLIDAEQIDRAEQALRAARAINPEDPDGHVVMALIHLQRNQGGQAQTECDHALELDPEMADVHYIRGLVLKHYHQLDKAEAAFEKALELAPASPALAVELARLKFDRGRKGEAAAALALVDEAGQAHPEYVLMMGDMAFLAGRLDEAYDRAMWVLRIDATDSDAVRLLSEVKFSRSGITGWPFRLSFWFDQLPVWGRVTLAICSALVFIVSASRWQAGVHDTPTFIVIVGFLAVAVFAFARSHILDHLVQRELRSVKLKDF